MSIVTTYLFYTIFGIVWGAFSDLPKKHYGWFIGRTVWMMILAIIVNLIVNHAII